LETVKPPVLGKEILILAANFSSIITAKDILFDTHKKFLVPQEIPGVHGTGALRDCFPFDPLRRKLTSLLPN